MVKLHARTGARDDVTGHWLFRCGLGGLRDMSTLPLPDGAAERYGTDIYEAKEEALVSCPRCRLRLTPIEKKVIRAMLPGPHWLKEDRTFQVSLERVTIWAPFRTIESLRAKRLISMDGERAILTYRGSSIARTLPVEKFDIKMTIKAVTGKNLKQVVRKARARLRRKMHGGR